MKWIITVIIAVIIALAVYLGLGWVIKDITLSMMDINDSTTFEEIVNVDLAVYASLAGVYNILCVGFIMERVDNDKLLWFILFPLAAYCISRYLIPPSIGSAVLFNLLNVSGMIIVTTLVICVFIRK